MPVVFIQERIVTILMFSMLGLSLLTRIIIGILYQNMIRQAENMSATENKVLKQCKLKFSNCYQLNNGVVNIPVFVDKCINRLQMGPFTYQTMYHLSGQMMLLSVFFAGFGICRCIIAGFSVGEILPFYIASFLGIYLYFAVSAIVDIKGRRRILKTNLVDYLENHMVNRLANTVSFEDAANNKKQQRAAENGGAVPEVLDVTRPIQGKSKVRTGIDVMPVHTQQLPQSQQIKEFYDTLPISSISVLEQQELEDLLKEFLTS